ncbi:hypothetical protein [Mesomycoplasma bovoculi]|uniref:Membrane nuclease n=1 Tax=Mesomycoplasma bovoculi M165/69 TaxID=743966 RepID=W5UTY4_9BACT|nr:hypothetical protein [Mesomycoplasma bovoculi]AHH45280.1 membrane nuclease [Mesomycoplasma bovoculi M165/69]
MKTKHILLLGLGSLTATAAIATPIALVNYDFGGGGKQTRIVVGNVNSDSATLEIPFSEKISSTKATVTLVYENKEEQVEAEIVNENDVTKVILTNLKPNTNYQIKQMEIDDKIINFKDSQFATKDNTLEQDVVVKPNDSQLPKTVQKTDENKEESKKNEEKQEDKQEQGQSTKVEEPIVTPGVGAQEPAMSLPQKAENKEVDNSVEKQKEEEKPKDQPDNSGPSSNISAQNEVTQPEPEVKKEAEKPTIEEKTQPKTENNSVQTNVQDSQKSNETSESDSTSSQVSSPSEVQTQENQISGNGSTSEAAPKDPESASQPSTTISTPSDTSSVENTQTTEETPAQTPSQGNSQDSSNASQSTSNTEATINQGTSSHTNNLQVDTSTIIRVGYWRTDNYSPTNRNDRTTLFTKVIKNINLSLIVISDIASSASNNGEKIVEQLNEENNPNGHWKQLTTQTDNKKPKISFIYNSDVLNPTPEDTEIKLSTNSDSSYVTKPVSLTFETKKGRKIFSFVSSIFNATGAKGKSEERDTEFKGQGKNEIKQAKELEEEISKLTSNTNNIIFMGNTNILDKYQDKVFEELLKKYTSLINESTKINTKKSTYTEKDVTVFAKKDADFTIEHPTRFDLLDFMSKNHLTDKDTRHAPVYVDLKFN